MAQIDFIRDTVSEFFDALVDSDLADAGTYTAPGGSPIVCRCLIGRGSAAIGDFGRGVGDKLSVRLVSSDLPAPAVRGAIVSVESDSLGIENLRLVQKLNDNGAIVEWSVERA